MTVMSTEVNASARLSLLRCLALLRDRIESPEDADDPTEGWYPLFGAGEHRYPNDVMILATREAAAMGHIDAIQQTGADWHLFAYMLHLTPAGYDYIKAHDAIGEAEQEVSR